MQILVVEDNADIAANIGDYLELEGHDTDFASDGRVGLNLLRTYRYDVVVLDVMLPLTSGLDVCRALRHDLGLATPVLMLTAKDRLDDKEAGFAAGADDYLVKPFALRELVIRIEALARRAAPPHRGAGTCLSVGALRYDPGTLVATRGDVVLELTPTQRRLLEVLMRHHDRVVRHTELESVLGLCELTNHQSLRVHIHGLRAAIDRPFEHAMLRTVRGVGYRLSEPD